MKKTVIMCLTLLLLSDGKALTAPDAAATCRQRVTAFLEVVKTNKEAQLTVSVAMQLMMRLSDKSVDEVADKFLTMLYTACYEEMRSKERI